MASISFSREALAQAKATLIGISAVIAGLPVLAPLDLEQSPVEFDDRVSASAIGRADDIPALAAAVDTVALFVHDHALVARPDDMQAACLLLIPSMVASIPATSSPAILREQALARRIAKGLAILFSCEAAAAAAQRGYSSRQQATDAREAVAQAFDAAVASAEEVPEDVLVAARECVTAAIRHIDETAVNLAPLAQIEVLRSMPSTALAWGLYRDPARAAELVASAKTGTSLIMPTVFIAPSR